MADVNETSIALICSAERIIIGWVTGRPGAHINRALLRNGFDPQEPGTEDGPRAGAYAPVIRRNTMYERTRDGRMLTCPICSNALVAGLPGQSLNDAIQDDLRLVAAFARLPDPKIKRARYKKGKPTANPLRAEPVAKVEK
jgi:hypothetical protein